MKTLFIMIFLFLGITAFTQQKTAPVQDATVQINNQQTEQEIRLIKADIDSLQKKVNEGIEALRQADILYTIAEEVYEKAKDSISMTDRIVYGALFTGGGFFITMLGLYGFSFNQMRKDSKKAALKAQAFAEKKIADITMKNEDIIHDMISKHGKEKLLLETTKILIINKKDTITDVWFKKSLERFNNSPTLKNIPDIKNFDSKILSDFDAVILDNINYGDPNKNWNFKEDNDSRLKLIEIARTTCENGSAFLYFGDVQKDGRFAEELPEYNHLINFANKPATLFANLIDLLDFRRLI